MSLEQVGLASLKSKKGFAFFYLKEVDGECEEDYVQFGRDILFITSHRSNKFCGNIEVTLPNIVNSSGDLYISHIEGFSCGASNQSVFKCQL